ncbi:hypothetical protein [Erythrobacter sp.]|jgi:hypothetical protein|uniref:hypothetical protein n=1 Tax=Erythrobacter sp. TaxID=1042 RepID=UPI002EBA89F3|nr:hypothetical protein [Erythrobacter sp.]
MIGYKGTALLTDGFLRTNALLGVRGEICAGFVKGLPSLLSPLGICNKPSVKLDRAG